MRLTLFLLPLVIIFEVTMGGWLSAQDLEQMALIRNEDVYYDSGKLYPSDHKIHYKRDRYGLRGPYVDLSNIDILTIGPSTVDQRYISEGETWQDRLAQRFATQGKQVAVANGGVDGFSVSYFEPYLEAWFYKLPNFHAKYVLLYFGAAEAQTHPERKISVSENSIGERIKQNSAVFFYSVGLLGTLQSKYFASEGTHKHIDLSTYSWTPVGHVEDYRNFHSERFQSFNTRVRRLVDTVRGHGARAIFVTTARHTSRFSEGRLLGIETPSGPNGIDDYHLNEVFTEKAMQLCRETDSICIDMAHELILGNDDVYDFDHSTPSGAEKIGEFLHTKLQSLF